MKTLVKAGILLTGIVFLCACGAKNPVAPTPNPETKTLQAQADYELFTGTDYTAKVHYGYDTNRKPIIISMDINKYFGPLNQRQLNVITDSDQRGSCPMAPVTPRVAYNAQGTALYIGFSAEDGNVVYVRQPVITSPYFQVNIFSFYIRSINLAARRDSSYDNSGFHTHVNWYYPPSTK